MVKPDKPPGTRHLLVVRTEGIREDRGVPVDAVVDCVYWHPGDRAWSCETVSAIESFIADHEAFGWRLLQRQDLQGAYECELVFEVRYDQFFGPSGAEIMEGYGLSLEDFRFPEDS
jgi:hypothetical protein